MKHDLSCLIYDINIQAQWHMWLESVARFSLALKIFLAVLLAQDIGTTAAFPRLPSVTKLKHA